MPSTCYTQPIVNTDQHVSDNIFQQGYHVADNFLAEHHYQALLATLQAMHSDGRLRNAKIGANQDTLLNTNIRGDQLHWLDDSGDDPAITAYFAAINTIRTQLNRSLFLGLMDFETHFALYEPGSFYQKHVDQFTTKQDRRISCVYYLNHGWQSAFGGELAIYDIHEQELCSIQPQANRFVCFSSDLPHEVQTTHQVRYSIAGWLKTRPA